MKRSISKLLVTFVTILLPGQFVSAAQTRPNILFIYVEDIGYYTSERAGREQR